MWSYRKLEPGHLCRCRGLRDFPRLQESAGRVAARALGAVDRDTPNRLPAR